MRAAAVVLTFFLLLVDAVQATDRYEVVVEPDLSAVEVSACFEGAAPQRLYRKRAAASFTDWLRLGNQSIETRSSRISLGSLAADSCASWRVNLKAAHAAGDYRVAMRFDDAVLTAGNLWFWRDGQKREIEVTVHLPKGMEISAPWPEIKSNSSARIFKPAATPASWTSRLALGYFPKKDLLIGGTTVRLAMLGDFDRQKQADMQRWIIEPVQGVTNVTGQFPQQQPQVLVVGIGPRSGPVPWAHVIRGGGVAVELFVDETRELEEFRQDYTATHEFSHLLLPYVSSQDRWLSEGLASYYQNVLRSRDGRLTEEEAWRKLNAGFKRGMDDSRRGGNMDTYWRGASILLQADAELRASSNGRQSLDTALTALHTCCYDPGRRWLALELFEKLDELTGFSIFHDLYVKHAWDKEFPDPAPVLEKLGVMTGWAGLDLNDNAPWSQIRQSIMTKPAARLAQTAACTDDSCSSSD